jgi:hypothetical protein
VAVRSRLEIYSSFFEKNNLHSKKLRATCISHELIVSLYYCIVDRVARIEKLSVVSATWEQNMRITNVRIKNNIWSKLVANEELWCWNVMTRLNDSTILNGTGVKISFESCDANESSLNVKKAKFCLEIYKWLAYFQGFFYVMPEWFR